MERQSSIESPKFSSPEEEIAFLREQLKKKESALEGEPDSVERERLAGEAVEEYAKKAPEEVLAPEYQAPKEEVGAMTLNLTPEKHDEIMEELLGVMDERGFKNALSVVQEMDNPHIADDFHRFLVQYIVYAGDPSGAKRDRAIQKALHMKLYEISLPADSDEDDQHKTFKEFVSAMEQFYAGMLSIADTRNPIPGRNYFTIELALSEDSSEIVLYASVPEGKSDLFEKQVLAVFPNAKVEEQPDDYNIFNENGASVGAVAESGNNPIFPLRTYDSFDHDPLNVLLNVFSKMKEGGEGAAVQIVVAPAGDKFIKQYGYALDQIRSGVPIKEAINMPEGVFGGAGKALGELFLGKGASKKEEDKGRYEVDDTRMEHIRKKVESTIVESNIRVVASAESTPRAQEILSDIESAFHQFENPQGNSLRFRQKEKRKLLVLFKEFSYRLYSQKDRIPLNLRELTTIVHFPVRGTQSPQLKGAKAGTAPAPLDLPKEGLRIGVNKYRGKETDIFIQPEDRLRHFYAVGQTGTGKTNLFKNMIAQDIANGEGVCVIDPHGSDIEDVLANIPRERAEDVIYFDPSYTARPMGLNMLEYDPRFPEQKTFVVNELLSIFQKLYSSVPESMGPAFEQYFRNATTLVIEDPETGNTLLDVSRVLSDEAYRKLKLSRCNNPVIKQFWEEIAEKAGGETFSLANIVPYITNKFDVFAANEVMRPIIAQQKSAFNFRKVMDERKILLVNLSKGRLGDLNANLIGLIIVGKILQAALSRVDLVGTQKPTPFYLYIDEFQNISTPSVATILSEARKYGLSLNVAHQFIDQLEENIKDAVFGNVGSMATFRVGSEDAEFLAHQYEPTFSARDIGNLDNFNAYVRLLSGGVPVKPFSMATLPAPEGNPEIASKLKQLSYMTYGRDRAEVEAEISERYRKK